MNNTLLWLVATLALGLAACGGSDADALGIGAQCTMTEECNIDEGQSCLTEFKGGYCGTRDCVDDLDCPEDSACVAHDSGTNFCFRICLDKAECNANRDVDNEANCSSSVTFTDGDKGRKACLPPSSGI